jgi:hypothetical protein
MGSPTSSYATASIALRVFDKHNNPHHRNAGLEDQRIPKILFIYNPVIKEIREDHRRDGDTVSI